MHSLISIKSTKNFMSLLSRKEVLSDRPAWTAYNSVLDLFKYDVRTNKESVEPWQRISKKVNKFLLIILTERMMRC